MSTMRIGGLASGMDIDSLVEKLLVAERVPLDKLEQQKQTYEWQRDAYRDVNSKLQSLDTYIADNLILKSLNTKTGTSSNTDLVNVVATSAASGSLTIEGVTQIASSARGVANQVNATSFTTLKDLFENSGITFPTNNNYIEIRAIQKDGTLATKPTKIEFKEDMTVSQFISNINSSTAGVNAVFENGRLSLTAKNTGDVKNEQEIVVDYGGDMFKAFGFSDPTKIITQEGKNAIFQVNGIATERTTNTFTISGYNLTLKETFNTDKTNNAILEAAFIESNNAQIDKIDKTNIYDEKNTDYQDALDDFNVVFNNSFLNTVLNADLHEEYKRIEKTEILTKLNYTQFSALIENKDTIDYTNESTISASINLLSSETFSSELKEELKKLSETELQSLMDLTTSESGFEKLSSVAKLEVTYDNLNKSVLKDLLDSDINTIIGLDLSGDNPINKISDSTLKEKVKSLTAQQLNSLDGLTKEQLTSFKTLATKDIELNLSTLESEKSLAETNMKAAETRAVNSQYTLRSLLVENDLLDADATEAKFNETIEKYISDKTVPQITVDPASNSVPAVTLTASTDVDSIVTRIKEFVTTYNGLILELNNLTKETKYRDYQPLTNPQKEELEEKEVELWEKKAKSGLLKGDSIITNGLSSMRSLIYQSNPAVSNSKYNTLYNVGITTSKDYFSGGTLELDEFKLKEALAEDPDSVIKLLSFSDGKDKDTVVVDGVSKEVDTRGFLQKLRGEMTKVKLNIEQRAGRATMNESQYTLGKYLRDVNSSIETWQDKLVNIEDRYWRQFSAMETAISKANNQSAMLMSQSSY